MCRKRRHMGVSSPWGSGHKQELEEETENLDTLSQRRCSEAASLLRGRRWIEDVLQADHLTGEEEDLADCP